MPPSPTDLANALLEAEATRTLGQSRPEALPDLACRALEAGLDSPALVEIAAMDRPSWRDLGDLWLRMLAELSLPRLDDAQAAHLLVLPLAQALGRAFLDGNAALGDTIIALEALNSKYGHREFLHAFCPLESEWVYLETEYPGRFRDRLEKDFREALQVLMALPPFDSAHPEKTEAALFRCYLVSPAAS